MRCRSRTIRCSVPTVVQASESWLVGRTFLACDRDRALEMPQKERELLPPEHLRWKVLGIVGQLDLSAFENSYRTDGQGGANE